MDISELQRTQGYKSGFVNIRKVTEQDKDWILETCRKTYEGTRFGWVTEDAERTFDYVIKDQGSLLIRAEKTFLYAFMVPRLCDYSQKDAYMELLVGEGNAGREPLNLLKEAVKWKEINKIDRFTISSVTSHRFGALMMKYLGAVPRVIYDIY